MKKIILPVLMAFILLGFAGTASALNVDPPKDLGNNPLHVFSYDMPSGLPDNGLYEGNDAKIQTIDGKAVFKVFKYTPTVSGLSAGSLSGIFKWPYEFYSVKFGNYFFVFKGADNPFGDDKWEVPYVWVPQGQSYVWKDYGLSHISGYNPVPVPAAVWLLGAGLVALAGVRKKMNK